MQLAISAKNIFFFILRNTWHSAESVFLFSFLPDHKCLFAQQIELLENLAKTEQLLPTFEKILSEFEFISRLSNFDQGNTYQQKSYELRFTKPFDID